MTEKNHFYLDLVYPEPDKIFSYDYFDLNTVSQNAIFVFDTNVLFIPFDATEKSAVEIKSIFRRLKKDKKLFIPARVAREFANNRAKRIGELFLKIRQTKDNLNTGLFQLDDYPILEGDENYANLKDNFRQICKLINDSRKALENIESNIRNWNWNDNVSKMYKGIFSSEVIIELQKPQNEIIEDLKFRIEHKVAPGYKDSGKIDDGIGDLVIWTTLLEIAKTKNSDLIFVSNDQKNDWFYKQDKIGLYPKYELFDEFRRFTSGKNLHIINFTKFLELQNAKAETIIEIKETIEKSEINSEFSRNYKHDDLFEGMHIEHRKFGLGVISKLYHSNSGSEWVQIAFNNKLVKHFILKFCDMRIIENAEHIELQNSNFNIKDKL